MCPGNDTQVHSCFDRACPGTVTFDRSSGTISVVIFKISLSGFHYGASYYMLEMFVIPVRYYPTNITAIINVKKIQ